MAMMQARKYLLAIVGGIEAMKARKCIGLGCLSAQMAAGREHLDGFSAPIGGSNGLEEITRLYGQYKSSQA